MSKVTIVMANTTTKKFETISTSIDGRADFPVLMNHTITNKGGNPMDYVLVGIIDGEYEFETPEALDEVVQSG